MIEFTTMHETLSQVTFNGIFNFCIFSTHQCLSKLQNTRQDFYLERYLQSYEQAARNLYLNFTLIDSYFQAFQQRYADSFSVKSFVLETSEPTSSENKCTPHVPESLISLYSTHINFPRINSSHNIIGMLINATTTQPFFVQFYD